MYESEVDICRLIQGDKQGTFILLGKPQAIKNSFLKTTYKILKKYNLNIIRLIGSSAYLIDTKTMANIRYLPSNGITNDVGGIISTTSKKNTWRLINIDIDKVT